MKTITGNAWRFDGLLDVDWELCPRDAEAELRAKGIPITDAALGAYCMTAVDAEFPKKVQTGDLLVGQQGFGYGHDHDHACRSIKGCGVAAVICESAAPYFLRNSFNHGLPVIEIAGIAERITTGDRLTIDLAQGLLRSDTNGWTEPFHAIPDFLLDIVEAGGVYRLLDVATSAL